ncbi:hypothetical protein CN157_17425 [Sinorhizobium meliloti]|nr:hypothetical protein CN157_17425 [Sinorhizobium meliloti]RVL59825.1 hypothetical protein CN141_14245 [Sinorhizobium meliloti]RVQ71509.1 hypothetical protein CN061_23100 [Sinorhizobium meliloti]
MTASSGNVMRLRLFMRSAAIREQPGMVGRASQLEGILNRGVCLLDDQDADLVSRPSPPLRKVR